MDATEKFNNVFRQNQPLIKRISTKFSRASGVPVEEFVSQLNHELWIAYEVFNEARGAKLETWLNMRLRDCAKRIVQRKEGTYYRNVRLFSTKVTDDDDETLDEIQRIKAEINVEDDVIKEADQRQLIDFFRSAKTDATTTLIVEAILGSQPGTSDLAIAKSLGLHHEIFKRKLRKLSRQFDANRFGEARDYLAV